MKRQAQPIPDTKAGTSSNLSNETNRKPTSEAIEALEVKPQAEFVTQSMIHAFYDQVIMAKQSATNGEMPWIEASELLCEHYNKKNYQGFLDVGYFIMDGVKVCAPGTIAAVQRKERETMEQRNFGHSRVVIGPIGANKNDSTQRHE